VNIYWLDTPACRDPIRVGGKAAQLGRLAATHPVPPGFCLAATRADARLSSSFQAELVRAYVRLGRRCGTPQPPVAVRSSAVDEDGHQTSFAGQHESYLNVIGPDAVALAVQRCLASARIERALHYRRTHGLSEQASVAVLVQQLVMADVSDKGMPAALFMALTRSLIRAEAKRQDSPRQVLLNVHRLLLEMSRAEMFVTVFYGVLDPARGQLRYARAGHDHPLLFRSGSDQCRSLAAYGMPLGFSEEVDLEEADAALGPGDRLILYSDGIIHAESPAGEFFGLDRLRQTVCSAGPLASQELCDLIFERVSRFQAGAIQFDDMALLLLSLGG